MADAYEYATLRVVPDMRGHVPKGPPRFAWLGARWQPTDVRNVQERRSVLPELRSSVLVHAEILKSHGPAWSDVAGRMRNLVREESLGLAADVVGIPFFGLMSKLAMNTKELITDRLSGPKRFDEVEALVPELNNILGWVEQLGEVDCTGVEPMTAVIPNHLRLRDDVIDADPLTGGGVRDAVLANAPAAQHGFFGVPKVIE